MVPRREWLPKYGPGDGKPVTRYHYSGYGSGKPGAKRMGKLGSSYGLGAESRSPLPPGVTSVTLFHPEGMMADGRGWVPPPPGVRDMQEHFIGKGIPWWEDRERDVTCAANLSREEAEALCLEYRVPSFLRITFGEGWDSFHVLQMKEERGKMKRRREFRVSGVNPQEVLEVAERTVGLKIPKIPEDFLKRQRTTGV
jgi:hypothetical protein